MVFIEVETDEGITGLGESLSSHASGIVEAIHAMKETLIGENPFNIDQH